MGTALSDVYDLFMMQCTDYRLTDLFATSEDDFETYLEAWLKFAVVDFRACTQSVVFNSDTKAFTATLTSENQVILATLMLKYLMQKNVNDITQMNLHIRDRDFNIYSESQNMKEKRATLNAVKEQCAQLLNDYDFSHNDWSEWNSQIFNG